MNQVQPNPDQVDPAFDRLMRGLIAVPKDELEAEIAKDVKKKAKDQKPKPKK